MEEKELCECGEVKNSLDCIDNHEICLDSSSDSMRFGESHRKKE